jgi:eukaryotic-like serine/threonine-protein kinase
MKRCPECRKDYLDDSLLYCLDDGTALVQGSVTDEPATAILSGDRVSGESVTKTQKAFDSTTRPESVTLRLPAFLSRGGLPWIAVGILALVAASFAYAYLNGRSNNDTQAIRLSFEPPPELSFNDVQPDWAVISPDGQKIAFTAVGDDGQSRLYYRELHSAETKLLPGSDNPIEPFWSPDSKSVAYGSNGKLRRSDLAGGNPQVLCDAARLVGGSWNKNGTIIFVPDYRTAIVQVSAKGGEPQPVNIETDDISKERHSQPAFLPDGRHFLFRREVGSGLAGSGFQASGIWAGSLDSPKITQVIPDNSNVVVSPDGHVLYIRNDALVAQAFDSSKLTLNGEPIPIIQGQRNAIGNVRQFSVSDNGVLIWQPSWERNYQLVWFDREGKQVGVAGKPEKVASGQEPRLSPDGKRLLIKRGLPPNLWVIDLEKNTDTRITREFSQLSVWSPEGNKIAHSGGGGLTITSSNGVGEPELILADTVFPYAWSPDGKRIYYVKRGVRTQNDILMIELDNRKVTPILATGSAERWPQISPDGRFLAYESDETGSYEVYVVSILPDGTPGPDRKRVSGASGGRMSIWRRDGSELFFIGGDGQMMVTATNTKGAQFEFGTPKALFKTNVIATANHEYDVSPDGQKFIVGTRIGAPTAPPPTIILNWQALLKN